MAYCISWFLTVSWNANVFVFYSDMLILLKLITHWLTKQDEDEARLVLIILLHNLNHIVSIVAHKKKCLCY